ncbi:Crp/Fnr family transcriptional regulator, partial [Enterocloster lavalensis]
YQSYFTKKEYQGSQCIHPQGTKINHFGIVVSGILKAVDNTLDGTEMCHAYFEPKDIFPEFLYFSGERYYTYSLYAEKKSTVIWVPVYVMEEMLSKDQQLMYALLLYISQRGLKNQLYLHCLNYQTIRERVAYWIVGMNNLAPNEAVHMPCSQAVLANMLHVSRASLNQELKLMEKEGFFKIVKKEMREVDMGRLNELL